MQIKSLGYTLGFHNTSILSRVRIVNNDVNNDNNNTNNSNNDNNNNNYDKQFFMMHLTSLDALTNLEINNSIWK